MASALGKDGGPACPPGASQDDDLGPPEMAAVSTLPAGRHEGKAYDACQTPVDCPAYSASKLEQLLFSRELQARPPPISSHLARSRPSPRAPHYTRPRLPLASPTRLGRISRQRRLGGDASRALVVSVHPGLVATELLRYSTLAGPAGTLAAPQATTS